MSIYPAAIKQMHEAVRGKISDHRSDIFAFGVILYEMITGRRAFHGETAADTMSAILGKEPPELSGSNPNLSPAISRIVEHCMEKSPEQRFQSMHDVAFYLETLSGVSMTSIPTAPFETKKSSFKPWIPWAVTFLTIVGSIVFFLTQRGAKPGQVKSGSREPDRFAIHLASDQELAIGTNLTFSPDGRCIVFGAVVDGRQILLRRGLGELQVIPIPGTDDGNGAFFSPDGHWLGFRANNRFMKVPAEGGRPYELEKKEGFGATWLADGTIAFTPNITEGLFRMSAEGGKPERLSTPDHDAGVLGHWWPQSIPGSRWVLFTAFRTPVDTSKVGAVNLVTKEIRWLVDGGFFAKYVHTGHLLYAKGKRLYALPFDAADATVKGIAKPVLDDLLVEQTGAMGLFDVSSSGTLAYVTESVGHPPKELVWLDREGHATQAAREQHQYSSVSLSHDDKQVALTVQGESNDLWIYSFDRGILSRITTGDDTEFGPIWSPDDSELFYGVDRPPFDIYRISARVPDSGQPMWKTPAKSDTLIDSVSPDGRTIVYTLNEQETRTDIYSRPLDDSEPPRPFRATRSAETYPSFSPDGNWLVYQSDETGRPEIYVEAFPGPGERFQISADGGRTPRWARNGEIFFIHDNEMRVVTTRLGQRFEFDSSRKLFTFPFLSYGSATYDITTDGKRILTITIQESLRPRQINIVTDWTTELRRLVPNEKE